MPLLVLSLETVCCQVFQCCKLFCGHFYHPKCAAELLQSHSNGACELENKIAAGMPFPCPVHWCFRPDCKKMEEGTERAMWLAGCRRCPRSYHLDCLPRYGAVFIWDDFPFLNLWILGSAWLNSSHHVYLCFTGRYALSMVTEVYVLGFYRKETYLKDSSFTARKLIFYPVPYFLHTGY